MEFLRLLEGLRTPALNSFFSAVTYLGNETLFIVLAIVLFWCVNKRYGYYCFFVGIFGMSVNQFLKLWYRIPRPWVLDPDFTIVEAARAGASGYSFPSGHTQNTVGTMSVMAIAVKPKWLKAVFLAVVLLVPFSRMYLGVHTPLDVGVAFLTAALLLALFWPCCRSDECLAKTAPWLLSLAELTCLGSVLFVVRYPFPVEIDVENLTHGIKSAYTLLGCALGLAVTYFFDARKLHFSVDAPLPGQLIKLVLGFAGALVIRVALKGILNDVLGDVMLNHAIRYFIMVVFCGCIWPMTFPLWAKIGAAKYSAK